jgi:hypothetical protein
VGNIPGSAPLFAIPNNSKSCRVHRDAFLEHANWEREEDERLIIRLTPERAVHLFGPHVDGLSEALQTAPVTLSKKYILVANLVAPICGRAIANVVSSTFKEGVPLVSTEVGKTWK